MSGFRVLVTGSRDWTDEETIRRGLDQAIVNALCTVDIDELYDLVTVVHGGARGADALVAKVAAELGCQLEEHPADWERHGKAAGPIRNAEMVAAGADICLAFPRGASRGTRGCMRLAALAGIEVLAYEGASS